MSGIWRVADDYHREEGFHLFTEEGGHRFEIHKRHGQGGRLWEVKEGGQVIGSPYQKVSDAKALILKCLAERQGDGERLTLDGLLLALDALKGKWRKQGATFSGEVIQEQGRVTAAFEFDELAYQVTILNDKTIQVYELASDARRPVMVPRGLPFPKGFTRTEGYDR